MKMKTSAAVARKLFNESEIVKNTKSLADGIVAIIDMRIENAAKEGKKSLQIKSNEKDLAELKYFFKPGSYVLNIEKDLIQDLVKSQLRSNGFIVKQHENELCCVLEIIWLYESELEDNDR